MAQQAIHHYVYAQGQEVAGLDEAGSIDAISQVTAFSNSVLGSSGVVVQDGDTLQSIAQRVYGNADRWYELTPATIPDAKIAPGSSFWRLPSDISTSSAAASPPAAIRKLPTP